MFSRLIPQQPHIGDRTTVAISSHIGLDSKKVEEYTMTLDEDGLGEGKTYHMLL